MVNMGNPISAPGKTGGSDWGRCTASDSKNKVLPAQQKAPDPSGIRGRQASHPFLLDLLVQGIVALGESLLFLKEPLALVPADNVQLNSSGDILDGVGAVVLGDCVIRIVENPDVPVHTAMDVAADHQWLILGI